MSAAEFLTLVHDQGRDNVRTPMQWDESKNGGFSSGTPWLASNPNHKTINVKAALADKQSIYYFYKELLAYRKAHDTLVYGDYKEHQIANSDLYIYSREGEESLVVVLNHSDLHQALEMDFADYSLDLQNQENNMEEVLLPWEARLYRKNSTL